MIWTFTIAGGLALFLAAAYLLGRRHSPRTIRILSRGFLALNALLALGLGTFVLLWLLSPPGTAAAAPSLISSLLQATSTPSNTALAAALSTGLAAVRAGIAVGLVGAAAVGAISEKPEIFGRTLIFVGLAEGIAIYGLIISFIVLTGAF